MVDDNDDDDLLQAYPEWRQAAIRFEADPAPYGSLLEHEWFYRAFEVDNPDEAATVPEYKKRQLKYLSCFKAFEKWLLEEMQMALKSRRGVGYEIVQPAQQTSFAMDELRSDLNKDFRKAGRRLLNTRLEELDHDQRRQHHDAMARLAHMRAMSKPRPKPTLREPDANAA